MKPAGTQHGTVCASAVPACPHCAALERELQEAREQLAVLQSDVEVAERMAAWGPSAAAAAAVWGPTGGDVASS